MRIPVLPQKFTGCLLLGASAVLWSTAANALSFNWSWTATSGDDGSGGDLTGTVVTGTIDNLSDNFLNTTGMTATFTSGFNVGQTVNYYAGNGIQVTNGSIVESGLEAVFLSNDYRLQLADPATGATAGQAEDFSSLSSGGNPAFVQTFSAPTYSSAAVAPGPLPILGLPAVLLYSRKLKRRIKAGRRVTSI